MIWPTLFAMALAGPPTQADLDACAQAQTGNTFAGWEAYLTEFPEGICARAPASADVADCIDARAAGDVEMWGAYAALHPRGFCITEAKTVLHTRDVAPVVPPSMPTRRRRVGGAETSVGPTSAHGALEIETVTASFAPFVEPLQGCGEGTAHIHLAVVASGEIAEIEVDGVDPLVAACVSDALAPRLVFPKAAGPTRIVHRLSLDPAE